MNCKEAGLRLFGFGHFALMSVAQVVEIIWIINRVKQPRSL